MYGLVNIEQVTLQLNLFAYSPELPQTRKTHNNTMWSMFQLFLFLSSVCVTIMPWSGLVSSCALHGLYELSILYWVG